MARITNVIVTANLNCKLCLEDIHQKVPMVQYFSQKFSGLVIRTIQSFKAICQIYENGKVTVNGGKSVKQPKMLDT